MASPATIVIVSQQHDRGVHHALKRPQKSTFPALKQGSPAASGAMPCMVVHITVSHHNREGDANISKPADTAIKEALEYLADRKARLPWRIDLGFWVEQCLGSMVHSTASAARCLSLSPEDT